jgi:hypothetical protein
MATFEVSANEVRIGDRLEDGQIVVGIDHDKRTDEYWRVDLVLAATVDGEPTETRMVTGAELLTVVRPD